MNKINKYFKLPLNLWDGCDTKVFTADDNMAFDFAFNFGKGEPIINIDLKSKKKLLSILNGESPATKSIPISYKNGTIFYDNIELLWIRSWGRLTGTLNLTAEQARQAQDEFGNFIIKQLTP